VKAGLKPGDTVIVVGASGMIGSSGILIALAMGAARIVALGRNREKIDAVARLSPRIVPLAPAGTDFCSARFAARPEVREPMWCSMQSATVPHRMRRSQRLELSRSAAAPFSSASGFRARLR
jgi:alcohol dehydrogenase